MTIKKTIILTTLPIPPNDVRRSAEDILKFSDVVTALLGYKGYWAGGFGSSETALANRFKFDNDTRALVASANLSQARANMEAVNSSSNGYFAGGTTNTGDRVATGDKLVFSTETTTAQASANLSTVRRSMGSCNSSTDGYFMGGNSGVTVATTDKLVFSTDTTAAQASANMTFAREQLAGCNSSLKGYSAGGDGFYDTMEAITFTTDTNVALASSARLTAGRRDLGGHNSTVNGYFLGGTTASSTSVNRTDRIVFSTDTTTNVTSANLIEAKGVFGSINSLLTGVIGGGFTRPDNVNLSSIEKLRYVTETSATLAATLDGSRRLFAGCQNNGVL